MLNCVVKNLDHPVLLIVEIIYFKYLDSVMGCMALHSAHQIFNRTLLML